MMGQFRNLEKKAFAWRPSLDIKVEGPVIPPFLVALGLSSGTVKLISLQNVDPRQDHFSLNRKELLSHANRFSAFLHWNPWRTSLVILLAQGLDRGKNNRIPSVLVWDVIRETGSKEQLHAGKTNTELSGGRLPPDSLYNIDKIASEIRVKGKDSKSFCDRPLCDACLNENVISFAWVSKNSFVVGLATRQIKLYDISDTAKTIQMTQTRLVHGLTSDPLLPTRFASFCQNQVALWAAENLEKPIYVFTERKEVVCIKWSPLREGWLGVLLANSTYIRIYNTLLIFSQPMEECEQFLFEARATVSTGLDDNDRGAADDNMASLVSFTWHGSIVNCIITIDSKGCLNVAKVNETTPMAWSPDHALLWGIGSGWLGIDRTGLFGAHGYTTLPSSLLEGQEDHVGEGEDGNSLHLQPRRLLLEKMADGVAQLALRLDANLDSAMQKRADAGYGLEVEFTPYSVIVADDPQLRSLWIMIEYLQECIEGWAPYGKCQEANIGGGLRPRSNGIVSSSTGSPSQNLRCAGALTILCGEDPADTAQLSRSTVSKQADWHGIDARLPFPRYASRERSRVLRMCMWPLDAPQDVQRQVLESVCSDLEFERAAAMALINLQFDWALSFLSRASEYRRTKEAEAATSGGSPPAVMPVSDLTASETDLIKLALSGFSDTLNDVWGSACADILSCLNHPYLRFMFKFLTTARGDFNNAPDFSEILDNESLFLIDRLTFACLYLDDEKLREYVRSIAHRMIREGRLEAILLTGLSTPDFFDLLQHYVDLTSDVQTAAILGLHACRLCRRAAPPLPPNPPSIPFMTPTPPAGPVVSGTRTSTATAANQSRLRLRGLREVVSRASLTAASGTGATPLPVDQVVAKMGGRRLANWVETYRDTLDRWRMWYYRVDFDNYYKTRLISPLLGAPGRGKNTASSATSGAFLSVSPLSPNMAKSASTSIVDPNKYTPSNTPVRGIGLPAGSSQIFASCVYCGWRLGGMVRESMEDSSATASPAQSPAGLTSAPAIPTGIGAATSAAAAAVAAAGAGGGATSMHAGGGKQTICWHCLKPLPRCSICLMHMGSEIGCDGVDGEVTSSRSRRKRSRKMNITRNTLSRTALNVSVESGGSKAIPGVKAMKIDATKSKKSEVTGGSNDASRGGPLHLPSWFVWCQSCRHGGHAGHIFNWFYGGDKRRGSAGGGAPLSSDLIECPVNGCSCHCAGLDSSIPPPRSPPSPPSPEYALLPRDVTPHDSKTSGDSESSTESDDSAGPMPFQTISGMTIPLQGSFKHNSMTPAASTPKNRREIVDPVILAMDYQNDEEEKMDD
ncbi:hypothetical protein Aperf_G00000038674 [Anoplocephala perfoliata]